MTVEPMPPAILIMWGVSLGPPAPRYRGAVIIVLTCCGASDSAGSRKLRAQADHRFTLSLVSVLLTRLGRRECLWQTSGDVRSF